jgi:hypothetical protein
MLGAPDAREDRDSGTDCAGEDADPDGDGQRYVVMVHTPKIAPRPSRRHACHGADFANRGTPQRAVGVQVETKIERFSDWPER